MSKAFFAAISLLIIMCSLCFAGEPAANSGPSVQNPEDQNSEGEMRRLMMHFIQQDREMESQPLADKQPVQKIEIKKEARKADQRINLNLKGSKFGDALRAISQLSPFYYSIASTPAAEASPVSQIQRPPLSSPPAPAMAPQASAIQGIYDIPVNFSYDGESVDEAVDLLCRGADVYCKKKGNIWEISKTEMYIIDKDIFFTYSVGNGDGSSTGYSSSSQQPTGSSAGSSSIGSASSTGAAGPVSSSASSPAGSDTIGLSGNFDDYVQFIKSFLTKDGTVQIAKGGYLVVVDVPSAIGRVKKIIEKDGETSGGRVKVDIININLTDEYSAGVNWDAVMKNVAINGSFAPANAFTFAYNTSKAGSPVNALLGVLGNYGKSKVVESLDTTAMNGIPIFFNVTKNIPYFTQTQTVTSGISQTSTTPNYINVGLKIKILPNIRRDTLNGGIYAELSELISMDSSGSSGISAPRTSLTNTAVPLELPWGDTFVLTGFKTKNTAMTASGVPVLSKLPFLGALFGSQQRTGDSSELAIVITATKNSQRGNRDDQSSK